MDNNNGANDTSGMPAAPLGDQPVVPTVPPVDPGMGGGMGMPPTPPADPGMGGGMGMPPAPAADPNVGGGMGGGMEMPPVVPPAENPGIPGGDTSGGNPGGGAPTT